MLFVSRTVFFKANLKEVISPLPQDFLNTGGSLCGKIMEDDRGQ